MSRETLSGEATVAQLCRAFGISRQAFYAAQRGRQRPQVVRLPRRGPWASAQTLEAAIPLIVQSHPGWGVRKVWATLRRQGIVASHKRVWALMHALGLTLPAGERRRESTRGSVAVEGSNRRWASDLTTVWTRREGWVALVPVIDCGDRSVLAIAAHKSQEVAVVLAPLAQALREAFGEPWAVPYGLELRTDHGPQYTGTDAEELCRVWGIEHSFAPVGRPTGNAVAERLIQTLKVELIWTRDWASLAELQGELETWRREYNEARPHQALDWQTPAERRARNLGPAFAQAA